MNERDPNIRSRQLGEALRRALDASGLAGRELAFQLGWDTSRVSRMLTGKRGCSEADVSAFLTACRVPRAERERLLRLSDEVNQPGVLETFGDRLPKQLHTLVDLEDHADRIADFQPNVVPGMLQTEDYARSLIVETGTMPEGEIEDRVEARMTRQILLAREPLTRFTYFIHELALFLPVGGPVVMSSQLHHLLRLSVRPNITLRVVPRSIGGHAGIAGPFMVLDIDDFKPVVYLDSETTILFMEEPREIATYRRLLKVLAETALDERQSREVIANLATELYPSGEDDDGDP